jgi:MFS transporter, DHA1 family, multidrug resistance protein
MQPPAAELNLNRPSARVFSTLRWTLLLVSLPFGILNFVLPIYGKEVGASALEIGMLFSAFSLMTVLLRPLIGAGLDRFGRRWFFIAGLAGYGLTMLGFAHAASIPGLVAARLLQGAASSLLWLAISALVADISSADERARSFGSVTQVTNQGAILGTFLGIWALMQLGLEAGWGPLFYGFAAAGFLAALLAWRYMPETMHEKAADRAAEPLRALPNQRALVALLVVTVITSASSAMVAPILMVFLQEKFKAGVSELAWAFFPAAVIWSVLPTRMGGLADRFGKRTIMVIALAAASIVALLIPVAGSLLFLTVLWSAEAVCFSASDPASQALIADLSGNDQRGRAYGLFALAGGIGAVVGPLAGGWLYDSISQSAPFIANGIVLTLSAFILWFGMGKLASRSTSGENRASEHDQPKQDQQDWPVITEQLQPAEERTEDGKEHQAD